MEKEKRKKANHLQSSTQKTKLSANTNPTKTEVNQCVLEVLAVPGNILCRLM
jgi:hypothetical protein